MTKGTEAEVEEKQTNSAIDRGWAWMILVGTGIINFILVGTMKSFGFFFVAFIDRYQCSVTIATLIAAMYNTVFIIVSVPLLTIVLPRVNIRTVCMIGAVLYSIGWGLSSVAPSIAVLVLLQSVLCGSADAMLLPPAIILLGKYFVKRRGLANGLAFATISLGSLVLPNMYRYILEEYGLQGALILTSGFTMHMFLAASLFRPLTFYESKTSIENDYFVNGTGLSNDKNCDISEHVTDKKQCLDNDPLSKIKLLSTSIDSTKINNQMKEIHEDTDEKSNSIYFSMENILAIESGLTGSVISLNSMTGSFVSLSYVKSITDNKSTHDSLEKLNSSSCLGKFKAYCLTYLHLLRNKDFVIFACVFTLGSATTASIFTFIPHHAQQLNIDKTRAALLLSIISITDFIGRILCGFLADRKFIKRINIIIISQIILCILLYTSFLYQQFWSLVLFAVLIGFEIGMIIALFAPVTVDIIGADAFPTGMTIIFIMQATFHGGLIIFLGYLRDTTGNYYASFYLLATTSLVAAVLLLIEPLTKKLGSCCKGKDTRD